MIAAVLLWYPPPGVSVAVLAFLAGIMPLLEPRFKNRGWPRIIYASVLGLLCFLEISSVTREQHHFLDQQKTQDAQHTQDIGFFQERFETVIVTERDIQTTTASLPRVYRELDRLHTQNNRNPPQKPVSSLKVDALELARDIFNFMSGRRAIEPQVVMPTSAANGEQLSILWRDAENNERQLRQPFDAETQRLYLTNYSGRVSSVTARLRATGVFNSQLCELQNTSSYVPCAEKIEAAAQQIPD
jgi:hypothetical protein